MEAYDENKIHEIKLNEIFADDEFNCRGYIDPLDVYELCKDIAAIGLIQPITIQPWDGKKGKKFRIVAGYRRYKATAINALKNKTYETATIRSVIKSGLSETQARIINLSENLKRRDLNILQEAKALGPFWSSGWNPNRVAQELGQSYDWVATRMKLLELPPELQNEAAAGLINGTQIKALHNLPTVESQLAYYREIKDARLTGIKSPKATKVVRINSEFQRTATQIIAIQDKIIDSFGIKFPESKMLVQALGWTAGLIDDATFYAALEEYANYINAFWESPTIVSKDKANILKEDYAEVGI